MPENDFPKGQDVSKQDNSSSSGSGKQDPKEDRDNYADAKHIIDEEIHKILHHVSNKLPPEVLERMDVMGTIKEKLHNYINQNYVNMFNRYLVTMEDEMQKKVKDFVSKEENKNLARYTPREITELLDKMGGSATLHTGEVEKSIVNMYGHLQNHVQTEFAEIESRTNALLRQKTDVGALVSGENAYSVVKCAFKDNIRRPKTVCDVKLSINILNSELISPIFHHQMTTDYLVKDVIAGHISDLIDKEIGEVQEKLELDGSRELTDSELLIEKIKRVEKYTDDDEENEQSKRYTFLAKKLVDKIKGLPAEIPPLEYDSLSIRENIQKVIDNENIRNKGFNTAVNSLTAILDRSKLGYQYIENLKNARILLVKEYEDPEEDSLPDERYQISLSFINQEQLEMEQQAYDNQVEEFNREVDRLWDTVFTVYEKRKNFGGLYDFRDLQKKVKRTINKLKRKINPDYEEDEPEPRLWDELKFVQPEDSEVDRSNRTYVFEKDHLKSKLYKLKEKLEEMYGFKNPVERVVMDERADYLMVKLDAFSYRINPYHVQPGLLLDIDITSIKKKKTTLTAMSDVLNEFLVSVSRGFRDVASETFDKKQYRAASLKKSLQDRDARLARQERERVPRDLSHVTNLSVGGTGDEDSGFDFQEL
ncbi:MAG: cytoplasmic filament protein CfpA [Spirochaetota bacterium]|nr:cytoplasmic filament protein CfpA [Spirochaetota bacterium]